MHDNVYCHCSIDYCVESILVKNLCENCLYFTLKWFLLNSLRNILLEDSYKYRCTKFKFKRKKTWWCPLYEIGEYVFKYTFYVDSKYFSTKNLNFKKLKKKMFVLFFVFVFLFCFVVVVVLFCFVFVLFFTCCLLLILESQELNVVEITILKKTKTKTKTKKLTIMLLLLLFYFFFFLLATICACFDIFRTSIYKSCNNPNTFGKMQKSYLLKEEGREGGEKKHAHCSCGGQGSNPGPAAY